jgi:parallel beta-helix repeat protein
MNRIKKCIYFYIISVLVITFSNAAKVYYVSPTGLDSNEGSEAKPYESIQKAADGTQPGDTVYVMQGTYTQYLHSGTTISIHRSGAPDNYIVYQAYPGHVPKIISPTWNAFDLRDGVAYIEINGFVIEGVPHTMSDSSGNGIFCSGGAHHIRILNNHVYNVPGGGIGSSGCDYLHIEGNIVHHTSFYSGYQNSGISLYQNFNFDEEAGYHNIIRNNISYASENLRLPLWGGTQVTDGNGIIIDDFRNEQGEGAHIPYTSSTLIENNIVFGNGGRGIHCYLSDHVVIVNNTLYKNSRSADIADGELTAINSGDIIFQNNIVYAGDSCTTGNKTWQAENIIFDYNLYFNTQSLSVNGEHDIRNKDPLFVTASIDAGVADFQLQQKSPAINAGSVQYAPETDFTGGARVVGDGIDLGAFESPYLTQIEKSGIAPQSYAVLSLYPNPFNSSTNVSFSVPQTDMVRVSVFDSRGRRIRTLMHTLVGSDQQTIQWNGRDDQNVQVASGLYFVHLNAASGYHLIKKAVFLK